MPQPQLSLKVTPAAPSAPVLQELNQRWHGGATALFDWADRAALMAEIDLVNRAESLLDEAAVKIAPSLLRIVLTVKQNLPDPKAQRGFLGEHLHLDFRRVSELCIVADSYALLDPHLRAQGAREIERYGWSIALKLAHVRDPHDRADLWQRACAGRLRGTYRDVLEEIARFRERKLIAAPAPERGDLPARLGTVREAFTQFDSLTRHLRGRKDYQEAVATVGKLRRELGRLQRTLRDRMDAEEHEELAGSA